MHCFAVQKISAGYPPDRNSTRQSTFLHLSITIPVLWPFPSQFGRTFLSVGFLLMIYQRNLFSLVACATLLPPTLTSGLEAGTLEVVDAAGRKVTASAVRTVVGWGWNQYGPMNIPEDIGDVEQVAAGYYHSITLQPNGSVKVWGKFNKEVVAVPPDLGPCTAVAGGSGQAMALKADGTVAVWGQSTSGQTIVPPGLRDVVSIAAGGWHCVALLKNGRLVSWGSNDSFQQRIPAGARNVTSITAGAGNTAILRRNGTVISWGNSFWGTSRVPIGLSDVVAIDAGLTFMLALKRNGTVVAWGDNEDGQCDVPAGLHDVEAISGGAYHSIALRRDGTVTAWGENGYTSPLGTAVPPGLSGVLTIDSGNGFSLALVEPGNDFGPRTSGDTRHHTLFLKNTSPMAFQNVYAVVEGADADQFVLQPPAATTLASGSQQPFTLNFTPTRLGAMTATLKIYSNAPDSPLVLPIKGVGQFQVTATPSSTPQSTFTYSRLRMEPQTGLMLQTITFTNTSGFALPGLKLLLSNVGSDVQIYGTRKSQVQVGLEAFYSEPIEAEETIQFDLVYFDPKRRTATFMNPVIKAEALLQPEPDSLPVMSTVVSSLRVRATTLGSKLEWNATPRKTYIVEYSDDNGATWFSAVHRLLSGGTRMVWLDRGQPETKQMAIPASGRQYRVKIL
jgi:hypothetical protein